MFVVLREVPHTLSKQHHKVLLVVVLCLWCCLFSVFGAACSVYCLLFSVTREVFIVFSVTAERLAFSV